jgi:citronellol/citronellal dehydrogenase
MSMISLGLAEELRDRGVAVNALWPRTLIATAALNVAAPGEAMRARKPEIMADAAHHILTLASRSVTGRFFLDEAVLREAGVSDFEVYAMSPGTEPEIDLFVGP